MKYMGEYYWTRTSDDLRKLRGQKYNKVTRLRGEAKTYFNLQETKKLVEQMAQIDAVLEARASQTSFA